MHLTIHDKSLLAKVPATGWAQPTKESSKKYFYEAGTDSDFEKERIATIQAVEE